MPCKDHDSRKVAISLFKYTVRAGTTITRALTTPPTNCFKAFIETPLKIELTLKKYIFNYGKSSFTM